MGEERIDKRNKRESEIDGGCKILRLASCCSDTTALTSGCSVGLDLMLYQVLGLQQKMEGSGSGSLV